MIANFGSLVPANGGLVIHRLEVVACDSLIWIAAYAQLSSIVTHDILVHTASSVQLSFVIAWLGFCSIVTCDTIVWIAASVQLSHAIAWFGLRLVSCCNL